MEHQVSRGQMATGDLQEAGDPRDPLVCQEWRDPREQQELMDLQGPLVLLVPVVVLGTVVCLVCQDPQDLQELVVCRVLRENKERLASLARKVLQDPRVCKDLPDRLESEVRGERRVLLVNRELLGWVDVLETRVPQELQG